MVISVALLGGLGVRDGDGRCDTAPGPPATFERGASRLDDLDKVIEYPVGHVFVEDPLISKLLQIEFQALELDACLVRHVSKHQRAKIRLAGFRADRGEFRASDFDGILATGIGVVEALELIGEGCSWQDGGFRNEKDAVK